MVRAVASRVFPRPRVSKAMAKAAEAETARMEELIKSADVPMSVSRIPHRANDNFVDSSVFTTLKEAPVALRPMGNSRRLFLLDPYLEPEDFEGLAYRIRSLSKNEAINSLLIATDDQVDNNTQHNCLPRYITDRLEMNIDGITLDMDPTPQHTWYVSGGYDPMKINPKDTEQIEYLLQSIRNLALAIQGNGPDTKVPIITLPHGAVTDGGFAFCMGSYVLATQETSFRILNPSRGLSFDPIGYSYILPRLGWEFQQESQHYPGCGMLLALAGYEADPFDLVETGLATHMASDSGILSILEEDLATMLPWNQQGLVRKPKQYYSEKYYSRNNTNTNSNKNYSRQSYDVNQKFRNVNIAYLIDQVSDMTADSSNQFPFDYTAMYEGADVSLDTQHVPWESGFFSSPLVDMAAALDDVFRENDTLEGIIERLKEIGSLAAKEDAKLLTGDNHDENVTIHHVANDLVKRMEQQSSLALRVVYQLMKMGSTTLASMDTCMSREMKAQRNLMMRPDFINWQKHMRKHADDEDSKTSRPPPFTDWQHPDVKSVTAQEVDDVLADGS